MKAIRGATTVQIDNAENIKNATAELLNNIVSVNNLSKGQIICIMFSSTADLKSYYPAKAARESGFSAIPLYSSLEPEIDGGLDKCIRVMALVDIDRDVKHVYLNDAQNLRKDLTKVINIALDGPAGSGKSTVAQLVAKKMDILCLDTGAMYRAVALKCINDKIDYAEPDVVRYLMDAIDLKVEYKNGKQLTLLDGVDVSDQIRTPSISMVASFVSAYGTVRNKMVALQRQIASEVSCILDGRDIGTNVLPNCEHKFFMTATPEIRADRRYKQNLEKGIDQPYEQILAEIIERDNQDKSRAIAPLKKADDAVEIDTSNMSIDEVVDKIISTIQGKI